ncbi:MAG: hypothetical protein ACMUHU_06305 [Thermoplasmatota archaeon]
MRLRIFSAGTLCLTIGLFLLASVPIPSDAVSYDPYEVYPGPYPRTFNLEDFNQRGDKLELTIVFKKTENGSFQERPISVVILDSSTARRNPELEQARTDAIFIRENVVNRLELTGGDSIVNPKNSEMSILFYNELQDGDLDNWEASAVRIRVDYTVINKTEEESNFLLVLILGLLIVLIVAVGIGLGYFALKRRIKASRTFFNPDGHLYYVFRDIDGSVFYFTEEQYTHMYNQNALVTFEYLGQATKKGGPVMIPVEEQGMYEEGMAPIFAQPSTPVPLDAQQEPRTLAAAPPPSDQYQPGPSDEADELYGQNLYDQPKEEDGGVESGSGPGEMEEIPPLEGDGSDGVLDELVSGASTITEEPAEEELILRLGKDEGSEAGEL